jgi:transmembrane sensor
VDTKRQYGMHELKENARSNVLPLKDAPSLALPRKRGRGWAMAAAVAALALTASVFFWQRSGQSYATAVGEQRTLELEDGSIVHLNTHSKIEVRLSAGGRDIELVAGEALFKVHRDPARPFRVHAQDAVIQALGTQFNVYRRPQGTTVSVLEGAVQVAATRLDAGEEARIVPSGAVMKHKVADVTQTVAWRQRRLVFDQDSLSDMIQEFNRYNSTPQFHLEGTDVANRHYTGVFDADDPESLIQLLAAEPGLAVERKDDTILVRAR